MALDFIIEDTGFELPEIDLRIQSLQQAPDTDSTDEFTISKRRAVSRPGDVWILGDHRLFCGNALDDESYKVLIVETDGP